jgi:hypothetical protein
VKGAFAVAGQGSGRVKEAKQSLPRCCLCRGRVAADVVAASASKGEAAIEEEQQLANEVESKASRESRSHLDRASGGCVTVTAKGEGEEHR